MRQLFLYSKFYSVSSRSMRAIFFIHSSYVFTELRRALVATVHGATGSKPCMRCRGCFPSPVRPSACSSLCSFLLRIVFGASSVPVAFCLPTVPCLCAYASTQLLMLEPMSMPRKVRRRSLLAAASGLPSQQSSHACPVLLLLA